MKIFLSIIILLALLPVSLFAQPKWNEQTSGTTNHLYSIYFSSRINGWAVGENGTIIHTVNSGNNWNAQSSGLNIPLNGLCFTDNQKGWIVANQGKILYTLDGGDNWSQQSSGTTNNLNSVVFTDSNTGWAVGINGTILHTTNAGTTWTTQTSAIAPSGNSVDFINSYGWIVADNGKIIATTNGGNNWSTQSSGTAFNLLGVSFADQNHGIAVGIGGTILKTVNAGNSWTKINSGTTDALLSVHFVDTNTAYAIGLNGIILYSNDGGSNWQSMLSDLPSTNLRDVFFYKNNPGWICANNGKILNLNNSETICLVGVDTLTYKYKLIWEQIPEQATDYYNIYKLSGTNYVNIGTVSYLQLSEFVDLNSKPNNKTERYKISAVDSYGNESSLSPYHEPMFLQANQGVPASTVNLFWNKYTDESGDYVPEWYYIYRGSNPNNMYVLDSVSGAGAAMYSDNNVLSTFYYRVTCFKPYPCYSYANRRGNPVSGPFSHSLSNLKDYNLPGIDNLDVYPNDLKITKKSQIVEFNVFTNLNSWDVSSGESWAFTIKDLANKKITVTVSENTNDNSRSATITLSGNGVDDRHINLTQHGGLSNIEINKNNDDISVFFDPNTKAIKIYNSTFFENNYSIELFNVHGQKVHHSKIHNSSAKSINVSSYKPGIYLLRLSGSEFYRFKIFIR
ncbi:MAG: YCF48-related protein, partial [Bacteroidota bacterium]|nr:YCF48-related protein [Bacteroidota bacterium]